MQAMLWHVRVLHVTIDRPVALFALGGREAGVGRGPASRYCK